MHEPLTIQPTFVRVLCHQWFSLVLSVALVLLVTPLITDRVQNLTLTIIGLAVGTLIGFLVTNHRVNEEVAVIEGVLYGSTAWGDRTQIPIAKITPASIRTSVIRWPPAIKIRGANGGTIRLIKSFYRPEDWERLRQAIGPQLP